MPGLGRRVKSGARSQTVRLTAGKPVSPSADGDDSSHLEGWWDFTWDFTWPARRRSTHLNQPWHTFGASRDALGQKREAQGSARAALPDTWKFSVQKALHSCVRPQRIRTRTEENFHSKIWEKLLTVKVQVEVTVVESAGFTLGQASKPRGQDATERTSSRRHPTTCPGDHLPTP